MILTRCPYCGEKISYFTLLHEKTHGEHFCASCRKESRICIQKRAAVSFILTTILSIIIAALMVIFNWTENLWTVLLAIVPFVIFFLISPIFVVLRPYRKYKEWMTAHTGILKLEKEEASKKKK